MIVPNRQALLFVVTAIAAAASPVSAATITQTFTVSPFEFEQTLGGANYDTSSFNQFNSALGTLDSITATLTGSGAWYVSVGGPDYLLLDLEATNTNSINLQEIEVDETAAQSEPVTVDISGTDSTAGDLTAYVGTGTEDLVLNVDISNYGVIDTFTTTSALTGTITYNYTPGATAIPEPGTLPAFAAAILGLIALRKIRRRNLV